MKILSFPSPVYFLFDSMLKREICKKRKENESFFSRELFFYGKLMYISIVKISLMQSSRIYAYKIFNENNQFFFQNQFISTRKLHFSKKKINQNSQKNQNNSCKLNKNSKEK